MKFWTYYLMFAFGISGCSSNPVIGHKEPSEAAEECFTEVFPGLSQKLFISFLYEQDGHLYTTLQVAKEAGIDAKRAFVLSYYSQYPDIDPEYEATPVALKYILWPPQWRWRDDITGRLHSLHGGNSEAVSERREELAQAVRESLADQSLDWRSGLLIHALGDSYAHTKSAFRTPSEHAYGKIIGHAIPSLMGRSPDDICDADNIPKYVGYVSALRKVMNSTESNSPTDISLRCRENRMTLFGPNIDWSSVSTDDLKGKPTAGFVHCMNQKARRLSVDEVMSAINKIKTGANDR